MSLLVKALGGAIVVVVIALVSRTRNYYLAGLVPLFPTFGLVAHYIVGTERSVSDLKTTILFGLWGVIPYCAYLGALYYLAGRLKLGWALAVSLVAWSAAAALLLVVWKHQ
jgi:uncharacterized membrane protein (GlpM family)